MKIVITGSAKEIAALVLAVQGRQKVESLTIGGVSTKAHGNDLIAEHGQNGLASSRNFFPRKKHWIVATPS